MQIQTFCESYLDNYYTTNGFGRIPSEIKFTRSFYKCNLSKQKIVHMNKINPSMFKIISDSNMNISIHTSQRSTWYNASLEFPGSLGALAI